MCIRDSNNPFGACPRCQGFGNTVDFDPNLVIPDRGKTINECPVEPWTKPRYRGPWQELKRCARATGIPLDVPFRDLSAAQQEIIMAGDKKAGYIGVQGFFPVSYTHLRQRACTVDAEELSHHARGRPYDRGGLKLWTVSYTHLDDVVISGARDFFHGVGHIPG